MTPDEVSTLVTACSTAYGGDARRLLEDAAIGQRHRASQAERAQGPRAEDPEFTAAVDDLRARGKSQRAIAIWLAPTFGDVTHADPVEALRLRVRRYVERKRDGSPALSQ